MDLKKEGRRHAAKHKKSTKSVSPLNGRPLQRSTVADGGCIDQRASQRRLGGERASIRGRKKIPRPPDFLISLASFGSHPFHQSKPGGAIESCSCEWRPNIMRVGPIRCAQAAGIASASVLVPRKQSRFGKICARTVSLPSDEPNHRARISLLVIPYIDSQDSQRMLTTTNLGHGK